MWSINIHQRILYNYIGYFKKYEPQLFESFVYELTLKFYGFVCLFLCSLLLFYILHLGIFN